MATNLSRRGFLALSVLVGATPLVASCSSRGATAGAGSSSTLVYVGSDFPANFDTDSSAGANVAGENIVGNTYGGDIVAFGKTQVNGTSIADILASGIKGGLENGFAKTIDVSADQRTITITLRDDIVSNLGNKLTSADVVWSFQRNFALKQTGLFMANSMGITSADQVVALDERTVRFALDKPNSIFFKVDAAKLYAGLFDSVAAKQHATSDDRWAQGWLGKNTAGFGAYTVSAFQEGQTVTLSANPHSLTKPDFDKVVWRSVPTSANRLALLQSGEADIAMNLSPSQLQSAQKAGLAVTSYKSNKIQVMPLNALDPNLKDPRIRQAIAYALPYADILSSVYLGTATGLNSPLPEDYPGHTAKYNGYKTNLDKAKSLMAEAGVSGFNLTLTFSNDNYEDPLIAPIVASALKQIGINVLLEGLPASSYFDKLYKRGGQAYLAAFWPFVADPAYALGVYWKSTSYLNVGSWKNAEFDTLIDEMLVEPEPSARNLKAGRAQQIWMQEQPWVLLANPGWHVAHSKRVSNVTWYPNNGVRFADLKLVK